MKNKINIKDIFEILYKNKLYINDINIKYIIKNKININDIIKIFHIIIKNINIIIEIYYIKIK